MAYEKTTEQLLQELETNRASGLSVQEAKARLDQYGPNALDQETREPAWKTFLKSLGEPIIIVLWIAIALSLASAGYDYFSAGGSSHVQAAIYESIAILVIIMVNAGITYWQTASAQKSLDALRTMSKHQVSVLRDDNWQKVSSEEIVPGDIVDFRMGDFIEGDVRWLKVNELQVDESQLTGEADAIEKQTEALDDDVDLADRTNMGYSGSTVTNGNGLGVIVATGMDTELGKIAGMMNSEKSRKTPIEQTINTLTTRLMYLAGGIVLLVLIYGMAKEYLNVGQITIDGLVENSSTAIAIAVAAIPDAMPVVLSIVLTIGATMLARNKGLVKSLSSAETLGATTYIASDKTGTLTKNEMTVTHFTANGQQYVVEGNGYEPIGDVTFADSNKDSDGTEITNFLRAAVLNNEASISQDKDGRYQPYGNPTDVSLVVLGQKLGVERDRLLAGKGSEDFDIMRVFPFDSTRKMMSVIIKFGDDYKILTKGAPDVIFQKTDAVATSDGLQSIDDQLPVLEQTVLDYANQALRTLAITERSISKEEAENADQEDLEQHLTMLGIVGIIDPPRAEVQASIKTLHKASINVVMITGDHAATARAIAKRLNIIEGENDTVIEGRDLDAMSDDELLNIVEQTRVYARVSPEHKQRVMKALQAQGEVVAMTGDGVNDAPALRAADIGIAMGINGTEVTKDSADLILMDDKFTTIEKSVEAGRIVFGNIRNFIRQELVTNVSEVLSLLLGVFLITFPIGQVSELSPTLTALMVLWVNMVSDSLPSFTLGYDDPEQNIMNEKPRDTKKPLLSGVLVRRILFRGGIMGLMVFGGFLLAALAGMSEAEAQTIAFLTLVFGQLWHIFDARSERTIFRRNPFSNKYLLMAVAFAAVSSILVTIIPLFNEVMGTAPLPFSLYLTVIFVPAIPTFVISGIKEFIYKLKNNPINN